MSREDASGTIVTLEKEPAANHPGQYVELDDGSSFCVPAKHADVFDQLMIGHVIHIKLEEHGEYTEWRRVEISTRESRSTCDLILSDNLRTSGGCMKVSTFMVVLRSRS